MDGGGDERLGHPPNPRLMIRILLCSGRTGGLRLHQRHMDYNKQRVDQIAASRALRRSSKALARSQTSTVSSVWCIESAYNLRSTV